MIDLIPTIIIAVLVIGFRENDATLLGLLHRPLLQQDVPTAALAWRAQKNMS